MAIKEEFGPLRSTQQATYPARQTASQKKPSKRLSRPTKMQLIGIAAIILTCTVLTSGAALNITKANSTVPFPSSNRIKRNVPVSGTLWVHARYAHGLPDRDSWAGRSDPYMSVTAYDNYGRRVTLRTRHIQGDHSPHWYQWLNFGYRSDWHHFEMSVWDSDLGADDRLTQTHRVNIRAGYHSSYYTCGSGCAVYYSYSI